MSQILIETNKYQTPITQELLDQYPEEIQEQFMDFINTVPLIQTMISPNRPYVKDLPRDNKGRAIVDITNPPIIEDADYFRQPALHFLKHKCYTKLKPNSNPNSEYRKFWDREVDRIYDGMLRESDGMWIPGYLYWFLNYNPMMINVYEEGRRKAIRKEAFGLFFEGIWWRFLYLANSRENGHHAIELAKRGAHPYFQKVYTPDGIKNWGDINIGDYLYDSKGGVTKVTDIPFDDIAPYYKVTLRDGREVLASSDHLWEVEVHGRKDLNVLSTEELLSIYKRQRKISYRNPEGVEYTCKILSNKGVEFKYEKTKVDPYTFGLLLGDGCFRHKSCYYSQSEDDLNNQKSFIPYDVIKWKTYCGYRINIPNWNNILKGYNLYNVKSIDKFIPDEYKYNSRQVRLDILKGLFDTDGTSNKGVPEFYTISEKLKDDVIFIARSLGYNASYSVKKTSYNTDNGRIECNPIYTIVVDAGEEIFNLNRKKETIKYLNNIALSRVKGTMITDIQYIGNTKCKCVTVDSEDSCYLIGDFVKTHNCGKSYSLSTIMSHNLIMGESREANRRCITVLTAYQKEYLKDDKDGTLNKFVPELAFLSTNTPFPRLMLKQSSGDMSWQMGYKDEYGRNKGSLNQVMGVSAKDDSDKLRGKRGWILFEEMGSFQGLLELYDVTRKSVEDGDFTFACMYLVGCVCAGTKVWTLDGRNINIEELVKKDGIIGFTKKITLEDIHLNRGLTKEPILSDINVASKECVRITLSNGNILECSKDHPIAIQKGVYTHKQMIGYDEIFRLAENIKVGDRVIEAREISTFGKDTLFDPRLVGMLIGDGTYGSSVKYCSEDEELKNYIRDIYECKTFRSHITKKGKLYEEFRVNGVRGLLNNIGILGQTKQSKRLPDNYQTLDKSNTALLLSGLYDTDGCVYKTKNDWHISITQSNPGILEQIKILWRKFGVIGSIVKTNPNIKEGRKDKNPWYSFVISGRLNIDRAYNVLDLLVKHKKINLEEAKEYYKNNPSKKEQKYPKDILVYKVVKVEDIGVKDVYNLTAGLSHTYLANNIVTHNTANNKESNFLSAKTLLYSPGSYNIEENVNVYDKRGKGKSVFGFFFPSYINRAGCYDENGNSDIVKALFQILSARYKAKYGADPTSVLRVIAEDPITPAEAIIKVKDAYFNVAALSDRAQQLDSNPRLYDDIYIGDIIKNSDGKAEFKLTDDIPIRKFPVDNDTKGALEIYAKPQIDKSGKVFNERYIIGVDPYDNDQAQSHSLYSIYVFDLFTDTIVAEYTGRTDYANDAHNKVLLLCLYYNAKALYESNKKGLFGYAQSVKLDYLLADTPQYLRDKQLIKYSSFGSNQKGVNASAVINNYANSLLKDWFNKLVTVMVKNENGEDVPTQIPMLYTLKNRALIEEAIQFTPEINVDRIRALGMIMLYRQQYIINYGGDLNVEAREKVDSNYEGNDKFFTDNYDNKFLNKKSVNLA